MNLIANRTFSGMLDKNGIENARNLQSFEIFSANADISAFP